MQVNKLTLCAAHNDSFGARNVRNVYAKTVVMGSGKKASELRQMRERRAAPQQCIVTQGDGSVVGEIDAKLARRRLIYGY